MPPECLEKCFHFLSPIFLTPEIYSTSFSFHSDIGQELVEEFQDPTASRAPASVSASPSSILVNKKESMGEEGTVNGYRKESQSSDRLRRLELEIRTEQVRTTGAHAQLELLKRVVGAGVRG